MGSQDIDIGDGRKITSGPDDGAEESPPEATAPTTALQIEPSFTRVMAELERIFGFPLGIVGEQTDDKTRRGRRQPTPEYSTHELIN